MPVTRAFRQQAALNAQLGLPPPPIVPAFLQTPRRDRLGGRRSRQAGPNGNIDGDDIIPAGQARRREVGRRGLLAHPVEIDEEEGTRPQQALQGPTADTAIAEPLAMRHFLEDNLMASFHAIVRLLWYWLGLHWLWSMTGAAFDAWTRRRYDDHPFLVSVQITADVLVSKYLDKYRELVFRSIGVIGRTLFMRLVRSLWPIVRRICWRACEGFALLRYVFRHIIWPRCHEISLRWWSRRYAAAHVAEGLLQRQSSMVTRQWRNFVEPIVSRTSSIQDEYHEMQARSYIKEIHEWKQLRSFYRDMQSVSAKSLYDALHLVRASTSVSDNFRADPFRTESWSTMLAREAPYSVFWYSIQRMSDGHTVTKTSTQATTL